MRKKVKWQQLKLLARTGDISDTNISVRTTPALLFYFEFAFYEAINNRMFKLIFYHKFNLYLNRGRIQKTASFEQFFSMSVLYSADIYAYCITVRIEAVVKSRADVNITINAVFSVSVFPGVSLCHTKKIGDSWAPSWCRCIFTWDKPCGSSNLLTWAPKWEARGSVMYMRSSSVTVAALSCLCQQLEKSIFFISGLLIWGHTPGTLDPRMIL